MRLGAAARAADVLLGLVHDDLRLPQDYQLELIEHAVAENWRQRHDTPRKQIDALPHSLVHAGPFAGNLVRVGEARSHMPALAGDSSARAISVTSRVWDEKGQHVGHLAIMNLHPVGFRDNEEVRGAVGQVVNGQPGHLLGSGRYLHYYGRWLLGVTDWPRFLSQFLMPCVLVSPRYIGHSLHRGFCALRLNAAPPHKPTVPALIQDAARPRHR